MQLESRVPRTGSTYTRSSAHRNAPAMDVPIHGDDDTALISKVLTRMDIENMLRHAAYNKIRELKLLLSVKTCQVDTCCLEQVCHLIIISFEEKFSSSPGQVHSNQEANNK